MKRAARLTSWEQTKILADPRRRRLLRLLMAQPATLSQLADAVGHSPAWVQHHLRQLLHSGLVQPLEGKPSPESPRGRYYRATAEAWVLQQLLLPESDKPVAVFAGSHDIALDALAERLAPHLEIILHPVGSLDGLIDLRQGLCHFTGAHLLDESGAYNLPYIRRLFPQGGVQVVTFAHRVQGLILAKGNPKGIRSCEDLARPDIRFVNRNAGSGTRLWLDTRLRARHIPPQAIRGYDDEVSTHTAAAQWVAQGRADVAVGLEAAARRAGLDFIPLFHERFDLVIPDTAYAALLPLLEALPTATFRRLAEAMPGYDPAHSGETLPVSP